MGFLKRFFRHLQEAFKDENFLKHLGQVETFVSKFLSIAIVVIIFVSIYDFCIFLVRDFLMPSLLAPDSKRFGISLFTTFGLVLNILIALEILENITAYLKKHVIQVELVIVTSLIAVARKIIILDFEQKSEMDLIALAIAIFALSGSYWIIRNVNR